MTLLVLRRLGVALILLIAVFLFVASFADPGNARRYRELAAWVGIVWIAGELFLGWWMSS